MLTLSEGHVHVDIARNPFTNYIYHYNSHNNNKKIQAVNEWLQFKMRSKTKDIWQK